MASRSRESKRIPLVESVCSLRDAFSIGFGETHVHYVAHPVEPRPQACLTVITKEDGSLELKDSVVILPKNVPRNDSITNLLYQSCLGLMQRAQAPTITQLTQGAISALIHSWGKTACTEPPFRSEPLAQMLEDVDALTNGAAEFGLTERARAHLEQAKMRGSRWVPVHLTIDTLKHGRYDKLWWILCQWQKWQDDRLEPFDRLVAYRKRFPLSGSDRRPEQPVYTEFRRVMGTFEDLYQDRLRLNCNTRNDPWRMRRLRRQWKAEAQAENF